MKRRIGMLLAVLAASAAVLLTGCGNDSSEANAGEKKEASTQNTDNKTLKIGFPSAGENEVGGLIGWAEELGVLEEELKEAGYESEFIGFTGAGPAVNEALASGEIDIAAYADFPGLVAKSTGTDIDLIGIASEEWNAEIIVKEDSKIQSLKDLKGKKIGYTKGTYSHKFLYDALESVGLSIDDVEEINLTTDGESALLTGSIDALCYVDGLTSRVRYSEGARLVSSTKDQEEWGSTGAIFVSHAYAQENRDGLTAFFKALIRAKEDITADYSAFFKRNAEINNVELETYEELYLLDGGKFDYISIGVSDIARAKIKVAEEFLAQEGLIEERVDIEKLIDNSYYEEAAGN